MQTVTVEEAKTHLHDLIQAAAAGEEVFIAGDETLLVQLVPRTGVKGKRRFGSARGLIEMSPDFDAPLEDFREYME